MLGVLVGVVLMFLLVLVWQLTQKHVSNFPMPVTLTVQAVLVFVAFMGSAFWTVNRIGNRLFEAIRLDMVSPLQCLLAVVGVIFAGALGDEVASLLHQWKPDFFSIGAMGDIADAIAAATPAGFVAITIALSLLPAISEEVMFRGVVLQSFRRDMPAHFAVIYSAILFGLVHFSWLQGMSAGLLGCYLGALVLITGSIVPAMLAHLVNNLLWCLLSRYEPGFMDDVLQNGHSPALLGGCLVVMTAVLLVMVKLRKRG
jgi:membrane protease YdiL (CAAX protease family)